MGAEVIILANPYTYNFPKGLTNSEMELMGLCGRMWCWWVSQRERERECDEDIVGDQTQNLFIVALSAPKSIDFLSHPVRPLIVFSAKCFSDVIISTVRCSTPHPTRRSIPIHPYPSHPNYSTTELYPSEGGLLFSTNFSLNELI